MSGSRQPPKGNFPFRAGDRVLFTEDFNIETGNFSEFMDLITRRLRSHLQNRWDYGSATVLPCPTAVGRRWIVINLTAGRNREEHYGITLFIEATTIYLHGYRNRDQTVFEFQPDSSQKSTRYLDDKCKTLSFGCNYIPMAQATRQQGRQGTTDPGLILEPLPADAAHQPQPEDRRRPNFGQERLLVAVRELAQATNAPGISQHRTAQNLLLVIIRFCESIRNLSVRREMVGLWTVPNRVASGRDGYFPEPSRGLSATGILHIKNWSGTSSALINHIHGPSLPGGRGPTTPEMWPSTSARTMGVASAEEAQRILVLVLFSGDAERRGTPAWREDDDDNNNTNNNNNNKNSKGRRHPRYADVDEVIARQPVWRLVPEEPLMEILGVFIPNNRGRVNSICGSITVTDNFGVQIIYPGGKNSYQQHVSSNSQSQAWFEIELDRPGRSISAYSCTDIDVDLKEQLTGNQLSTGQFSWNICNFLNNVYDEVLTATIGHARLMYIVYRKAAQIKVRVTVDNCENISQGSVTTSSTYFTDNNTRTPVGTEGLYLPITKEQPMNHRVQADGGPHMVMHWQGVVTVPLDFSLKMTISLLSHGSRRPLQTFFEVQPFEMGGYYESPDSVQLGATVKVAFDWKLLPWALEA